MSETSSNKSKSTYLSVLLLVLFVIAVVQGWYMLKMSNKIDVLNANLNDSFGKIQALHANDGKSQNQADSNGNSNGNGNNESVAITNPAVQQQSQAVNKSATANLKNKALAGAATKSTIPSASTKSAPSATTHPAPPVTAGRPNYRQRAYPFNDPFFNNNPFGAQPYGSRNWNADQNYARMQREMERMMNDAYNRYNINPYSQQMPQQGLQPGQQRYSFHQNFSMPEMKIKEDADKYTVSVNLPGSDEKDVSVSRDGQRLTVKGEQHFEKQDKDNNGNVIFQEHSSQSFNRSVTLPGPVKQTGMKTRIDNGVLRVTVIKDS